MDEIREGSIHHTALKFTEDIKNMKIYSNLYKTVQVSAALLTFTSLLVTVKCLECQSSATGSANQELTFLQLCSS
jgi:archaellum biogenesis protein FlaJ (TadC family)